MTGKRALIGCAIGCGGLVVLVVCLLIGFGVWVQGSRELLEPRTLLGPETTGYLEWTLRQEDPGTAGFLAQLTSTAQRVPSEAPKVLPNWMLGPLARHRTRQVEKDLRELLPLVVAWTLRPGGTPAEDLHLVTLSIEHLGNRMVLIDVILGFVLSRGDGAAVERYGSERIYRLPLREGRHLTFFIRNAHLFFTSDLATARQAVDRLVAPGAGGSAAIDELFAETEGGGPLRGVVTNQRGELTRLWRLLAAVEEPPGVEEAWSEVRGLTLAGGLAEDGSLDATLRLHGPDAAWAERRSPELGMALQLALAGWTETAPELRARPDGEVVEVRLHLPELIETLTRQAERAGVSAGSGGVTIER